MSHTGKKWRVRKPEGGSFPVIETDDEYQLTVCKCYSSLDQQADAALIIQAPKMVELLELVLEKYTYEMDDFDLDNIRTAVNRARGHIP